MKAIKKHLKSKEGQSKKAFSPNGEGNKSYGDMMGDGIITLDVLSSVIKKAIGDNNLGDEGAKEMAYHVLNFFGYNDRILDNVLEPADRDSFYMLEDKGILVTEREETTLYDGREWRIHYWIFKKDVIKELLSLEVKDREHTEYTDASKVYETISADIWNPQSMKEEQ
ncbi:MAG: DUF6015 family protein [Thermoplasmata archaeon]